MSEDKLDDAIVADKEALEGLIEKGLIIMIGYDPLGRPVYTNTALGNAVADEIERQEKTMNLGPEEEEEELIPYDETEDDDEDWTIGDEDFDSYDDEDDELDDESDEDEDDDLLDDDEDEELEDDEDWDDDADDSEESF